MFTCVTVGVVSGVLDSRLIRTWKSVWGWPHESVLLSISSESYGILFFVCRPW